MIEFITLTTSDKADILIPTDNIAAIIGIKDKQIIAAHGGNVNSLVYLCNRLNGGHGENYYAVTNTTCDISKILNKEN